MVEPPHQQEFAMPRFRFPVDSGLAPAGTPPTAAAVLARLDALGLPHPGVEARVNGEAVTLAGQVADGALHERLVLAVGNLHGIGLVDDRLATAETRGLLDSLGSFARLPAGSAGTAPAAEAVHAARPEPSERFGAGGSLFHTVGPAETLASIAERHYGDAAAARGIIEANRPMLESAQAVAPGIVLRLPPK
jgi:nucleoid-associated protein YgaU